jgi:hypothetical protein
MKPKAALAGLLCAGAVALTAAAPASAFQIVPHRAVYSMELARGGGSDVADVDGSMMFEWADSCDGWTVTQRYQMRFLYSSGEERDLAYNLVTWESKDGLRYRFFVRRTEDGEQAEELRGDARLDSVDGAGTASYALPESKSIALPPGTLFPTAHSLRLIERAEAGDSLMYAQVFDGSDASGLFEVNAVVVPREALSASAPDASAVLEAGKIWDIGLAYYDSASRESAPKHEQFLGLRANGVVEDLLLDYGRFAVDAKLQKLEKLPAPSC